MRIGIRYTRSLALPYRWGSWIFGGVPAGMRVAREEKLMFLTRCVPTCLQSSSALRCPFC